MAKSNFQFYATHDEIMHFIDRCVSAYDVHIYLIRVSPEYNVLEIKRNQQYQLNQWTFVLFSESIREMNTYEEYLAYSKTTHGDLIMCIGEETELELKESFIGVATEHSINPMWIKFIGTLKKKCKKGAYVVTPQNKRQYYPYINYSEGAQAAYRKGKTICPVVGWNRIELIPKEIP